MCWTCDQEARGIIATNYQATLMGISRQGMRARLHYQQAREDAGLDGYKGDDGLLLNGDTLVPPQLGVLIITADAIPNDTSTTATVTVGGPKIVSTIDTVGDQDFFKVTLEAGKTYEIGQYLTTTGPNGVPLADAFIELYDANGKLIVVADGGGPNTPSGLDALLTYTAETGGTYYINARAYDQDSLNGTTGDFVGDYELFVREASPFSYKPYYDVDSPLYALDWGTQVDGSSRNPDGQEGPRVTGNEFTGHAYNPYGIQGKNVIYYYFAKEGEVFVSENPADPGLENMVAAGFRDWEKRAFEMALDEYEKVADIVYIEVQDRNEADFIFITYDGTPRVGVLGRMSPPDTQNEGQAEFNRNGPGWTEQQLQPGGFSFITLIHELGHGHGMAHPHDGGGRSGIMRGVEAEGAAFDYTTGDFDLNQGVYTMMSYEDGWQKSPYGQARTTDSFGWLGGLMAFDIAVIQDKYGVNEEWATGNDTYVLKDVNAQGTFYSSIWDAGGTDEIVYDGARNTTIDLRAATLKYEPGGGGFISYAFGIHGGFTIANGVTIENARSGSGNDSLFGNGADNRLDGGSGNDMIHLSAGGVDTALGGAGADTFLFGKELTAADSVDGGADKDQLGIQGNYNLTFGALNLVNIETLAVMTSQDNRFGTGSNDPAILFSYNLRTVDANVAAGATLTVNANALVAGETLTFDGSAELDGAFFFFGGKGTDQLTGGAGSDSFMFGQGAFGAGDRVVGGAGSDQLGLRGNYTIVFGADQMAGIETLGIISGSDTRFGSAQGPFSYNVTTHDGNVAAGQRLSVNAADLLATETLAFDGSAETDGFFRVIGGKGADRITGGAGNDSLFGGLGADVITGGGGADTFVYRSAAESTGINFDQIVGFDYRVDRIDLPGTVSGWTGNVGGVLNGATFNTDLALAVDGVLEANSAVLFAPTLGDYAGRTFAVIDRNGDGRYVEGEDLVIEFVSPPVPLSPTTEYFV